MSKKMEFIQFVKHLQAQCPSSEMPTGAQIYWDAFIKDTNEDKPLFTENGKRIMDYLQSLPDATYSAREIAAGLGITSHNVSGAIRKLVSDGYVEKVGQDPVVYTLTQQIKETNEQ